MIDKQFLDYDYSEEASLDSEEIKKLLLKADSQREELIAALARYLFATYTGKNILVRYKDEEICVICRGMKFHVYAPDSEYIHPLEYDFSGIINSLRQDSRALDKIETFKVLTDKEAIEFIRGMYLKRAEESKAYLANILSWED